VLSVANCQLELKDSIGARKTLADLLKAYPKSEAAVAAKERLATLK
jgi:TolA-binding protein